MKATIEVKLRPFTVPNFVIVDDSENPNDHDGISYPLSTLDPETLDRLCAEFRLGVFKKAGKQQPVRCAPER